MRATKRIAVTLAIVVMVAGCAKKKDEPAALQKSNLKVVYIPPVKFSSNPDEKHKQQVALVEAMLKDPQVPYDNIEGEAARRGVIVTKAQLDAKREMMAKATNNTPKGDVARVASARP